MNKKESYMQIAKFYEIFIYQGEGLSCLGLAMSVIIVQGYL